MGANKYNESKVYRCFLAICLRTEDLCCAYFLIFLA